MIYITLSCRSRVANRLSNAMSYGESPVMSESWLREDQASLQRGGVPPHLAKPPPITWARLLASVPTPEPDPSEWESITLDLASFDNRLGRAVNDVIARLVEYPLRPGSDEEQALIQWLVHDEVTGVTFGRLDRVRARARGLVGQYDNLHRPPANAQFLGAEVAARGGRVDLLWKCRQIGIWADETKCWRHSPGRELDEETWAQVWRYMDWGIDTFGAEFVGVRVLLLGHMYDCLLVQRDGIVLPLSDSRLSRKILHRAASANTGERR